MTPADHDPARRRRLTIAAVVVVLLLLGGVAVALTRGDDGGSASAGASTSTPTPTPDAPSTSSASPGDTQPSSSAPSATASTPAPSPGETVPTLDAIPTTAAPLGETGDLGNGVRVRIVDVEAVDGQARGIGEVAAPSIRFTVTVDNGTDERVSLDTSVVNVSYGARDRPASQLSGPGARPMPASVAAGRTARGTFVFSVPESRRGDVRIAYSYTASAPTVVFEGAAR